MNKYKAGDIPDSEFKELYGNVRVYRSYHEIHGKEYLFFLVMPGEWNQQKADSEATKFHPDQFPVCRAMMRNQVFTGTIVY